MKCALCRGEMVRSKTTLPYDIGDEHMVVVKDVPALICKQCGEPFVEIKVVRVVEKIVEIAQREGVTLGFVKYKDAA
jgi:YgiT-type zinc finger domain-containing protein